jgi:hypothetical protein
MRKTLALLTLSLLILGLVLPPSSAQQKQKKPKPGTPDAPVAELSKEALKAQQNAEWMVNALKLKQRGWGQQGFKGRWENVSIESLLAAAQILKELPPVGKLETKDVAIKAGKEPGAPETTDTKLPAAQEFDSAKEANLILKRARELVQQTVQGTNAKQADAYLTLIAAIEKVPEKSRSIAGGPKMVKRDIKPGQWHAYEWKWQMHEPGMVGLQASVPLKILVVHTESARVLWEGTTTAATPQFVPGGGGSPSPEKKASVTVRVVNTGKDSANYVLVAQ